MKKQVLIAAITLLSLTACGGNEHFPCKKNIEQNYRPMVFFAVNSAELTSHSKMELGRIVKHMGNCPHQKIRVIGYTDSTGSSNYNMMLGEKRALAVQDYLLSLGVHPKQIEIISEGENDPIASNSTASGRSENRRAVVKFY